MRSSSRQTCCVVCQGPKPVERWLLEMLDGIAPAGFLVETRRNVLFISSAGLAQQLSLACILFFFFFFFDFVFPFFSFDPLGAVAPVNPV